MLGILLLIGLLSVGESGGQYTGQAYEPQNYYRKAVNNFNTGRNSPQITERNAIPSDQWQQTARSPYYNPYYLQQWYGNPYSQQLQSGWIPYLSRSQGYYSNDRSEGYGYEYPRPSYNLPYYQPQNFVGNPFYDGAGYGPRWINDIDSFGGRRQDTRWYGRASRRNGLTRTTPKPPKTSTTTVAPTKKNVPRRSKLFVPNVWG